MGCLFGNLGAEAGGERQTVETHRMKLMCRLDIHDVAGLVVAPALSQDGWLDLRPKRRSIMRFLTIPLVTAAAWMATGCGKPAGVMLPIECLPVLDPVFSGGPGRDAIPALDYSEVVPAQEAGFLRDDDRVLGVEIDGAARAYPLLVMWWHEVANDTLSDREIVISYCPLTGSGLAFDAVVEGSFRQFGVSGLLFENNLIMFDRQTESLWNQLLIGAQCGPERGKDLSRVPILETTWEHWRSLYPQTTVVTANTGFLRNYGAYPYGDYDDPDNDETLFPTSSFSDARPPKELVLGVREGGDAVAFPFGLLEERGTATTVNDQVGATPILVTYWTPGRTARAFDRRLDGQTLSFGVADPNVPTFTDAETGSTWNALGEATTGPLAGKQLTQFADAYTLFWFAWSVYHPETRLLQ